MKIFSAMYFDHCFSKDRACSRHAHGDEVLLKLLALAICSINKPHDCLSAFNLAPRKLGSSLAGCGMIFWSLVGFSIPATFMLNIECLPIMRLEADK
ncbi:hypothetical protein [Acetobacter okinawensis]|uniref:hypothetical protein n=1 Tax=Acetobacter okinawensis TaxID=1076594 RepID=UPI00131F1A3D|nr:hypothetical protein [Acetobacter okinawensis]